MAVLPIRLYPDPVLRQCSEAVAWRDSSVPKFLRHLTETLYAQPEGIGIAAPQVGEAKQIIIIDVSPKDSSKHRLVMMNPKICQREGTVLTREGCMSLPDYTANVNRAARVVVEWIDTEGGRHVKTCTGIEAIFIQHEVDHLNGLLFIDRVGSLKSDVFVRRGRER